MGYKQAIEMIFRMGVDRILGILNAFFLLLAKPAPGHR
jgi:hypothetical protein